MLSPGRLFSPRCEDRTRGPYGLATNTGGWWQRPKSAWPPSGTRYWLGRSCFGTSYRPEAPGNTGKLPFLVGGLQTEEQTYTLVGLRARDLFGPEVQSCTRALPQQPFDRRGQC